MVMYCVTTNSYNSITALSNNEVNSVSGNGGYSTSIVPRGEKIVTMIATTLLVTAYNDYKLHHDGYCKQEDFLSREACYLMSSLDYGLFYGIWLPLGVGLSTFLYYKHAENKYKKAE